MAIAATDYALHRVAVHVVALGELDAENGIGLAAMAPGCQTPEGHCGRLVCVGRSDLDGIRDGAARRGSTRRLGATAAPARGRLDVVRRVDNDAPVSGDAAAVRVATAQNTPDAGAALFALA